MNSPMTEEKKTCYGCEAAGSLGIVSREDHTCDKSATKEDNWRVRIKTICFESDLSPKESLIVEKNITNVIESLLASQKKEIAEKIEKLGEDPYLESNEGRRGYIRAVTDCLALLSSNNK